MGEVTLAVDLETSFAELYRDLQKRAARKAVFCAPSRGGPKRSGSGCTSGASSVIQIEADEVVGFMHLDLKGRDYPIVEENWEREVRGLCSLSGARFRFEFHVVREVDGKGEGGVKHVVAKAGCGLADALRRVLERIGEALRRRED